MDSWKDLVHAKTDNASKSLQMILVVDSRRYNKGMVHLPSPVFGRAFHRASSEQHGLSSASALASACRLTPALKQTNDASPGLQHD